jgi:predicted Fe-Mo cluster-binding NifX family protein
MKVGVAAMEGSLDAKVSAQFARCPCFVIVDSDTLEFEVLDNPARQMAGGAGPAAVQDLVNHGVQAAVAGQFGPKAEQALQAAGIRRVSATGNVRDAVASGAAS